MTNPVVKIPLQGKSIYSSNPRDYALHSSYNSIKIFKKGSGSQTVNASSNADVTISHNLGFYPMSIIYVELTPGSGKWYAKPFRNISSENTYISDNTDHTYANTSNLYFRIINKIASQKIVNYFYFILGHSGK